VVDLRPALSSLNTCSNPSSVGLVISSSIKIGETRFDDIQLFCFCASAVCRFFIKKQGKISLYTNIKSVFFFLLFVAFLVDVVFLMLFLLLHKFQPVLSICLY
jgi:ribosome biogenesis protein Nip4